MTELICEGKYKDSKEVAWERGRADITDVGYR